MQDERSLCVNSLNMPIDGVRANKAKAYFPTEQRFQWQKEDGQSTDTFYSLPYLQCSSTQAGFGSGPQNNFMGARLAQHEAGPGSYKSTKAHGRQIESSRRTMPTVKFSQAPLPSPADNTPSPGPAYSIPSPTGRGTTIGKAVRGGFFSLIGNNAGPSYSYSSFRSRGSWRFIPMSCKRLIIPRPMLAILTAP